MYAPNLPVIETEISEWNRLLATVPFEFGGDPQKIFEYVEKINTFSPQEKGEDLGRCVLIMAETHNRKADMHSMSQVLEISTEATCRAISHVLYLKSMHQSEFLNGNNHGEVLTSNLIDGSIKIREQCETDAETIKLGIKMVEYIAAEILD